MSSKTPSDRGSSDGRHKVMVLAGGGIGPVVSQDEGRRLLDTITVDDVSPDWAESDLVDAKEAVSRLGISDSDLDGWLRSNKAIAFRNENEELFFPVRQFEAGRPVAGLDLVSPLFGSVEDAWEWLVASNRMTGGDAPLDWLRRGNVAQVVSAARGALNFA